MQRYKILWVDDEIELLKPYILYLEEKNYIVENDDDQGINISDQQQYQTTTTSIKKEEERPVLDLGIN